MQSKGAFFSVGLFYYLKRTDFSLSGVLILYLHRPQRVVTLEENNWLNLLSAKPNVYQTLTSYMHRTYIYSVTFHVYKNLRTQPGKKGFLNIIFLIINK